MQLDDYLKSRTLTTKQFAAKIDATHWAVMKWRIRARVPRPFWMLRIQRATKNAVSPADWMPKEEK